MVPKYQKLLCILFKMEKITERAVNRRGSWNKTEVGNFGINEWVENFLNYQ